MAMELKWQGCCCEGREGGGSSVTDYACKSILRDGQRHDAGEHCSSISAAMWMALWDDVTQWHMLKLPLAVYTKAGDIKASNGKMSAYYSYSSIVHYVR
jgi:hypothetical protein